MVQVVGFISCVQMFTSRMKMHLPMRDVYDIELPFPLFNPFPLETSNSMAHSGIHPFHCCNQVFIKFSSTGPTFRNVGLSI